VYARTLVGRFTAKSFRIVPDDVNRPKPPSAKLDDPDERRFAASRSLRPHATDNERIAMPKDLDAP
jgi:hypothetical protein